jgi:hydrogenase-4 component F
MLQLLFGLPILAGIMVFRMPWIRMRRGLLLFTAFFHALLTALCWAHPPRPVWGGWLFLDGPGLLFLGIISLLFLVVSFYTLGYLARENWGRREDFQQGFLFTNAREPTFICCQLLFLGTMTLVTMSQHFGLLWVSLEATTLVSAPLIYFHRHRRSLEATWKYVLICSVGIALALLGNFFLAVAAARDMNSSIPLVLSHLIEGAKSLHLPWLKAAFIFLLVGYGTKLGLAPMHTWLPDAHSESPSVISALLSGALLNCAFLAILRIQQVCTAAGIASFGRPSLIVMGLLSMAVAASFILGQKDFKRMLAYSSVEHMGILCLALGLGADAGFGMMLHTVNHALTKGMLFLVAGNILSVYKSKSTLDVRGVNRVLPISGVLWVAGFLAITGSPPFGPFYSELLILKAALDQGRFFVAGMYLLLLCLVFIAMATIVLRMAQGQPAGLPEDKDSSFSGSAEGAAIPRAELFPAVFPPMILGGLILMLGVYIPPALQSVLEQAARAVGGSF